MLFFTIIPQFPIKIVNKICCLGNIEILYIAKPYLILFFDTIYDFQESALCKMYFYHLHFSEPQIIEQQEQFYTLSGKTSIKSVLLKNG